MVGFFFFFFGHLSYILSTHLLAPPIFLHWFWHLGFIAFTHRTNATLSFLLLNKQQNISHYLGGFPDGSVVKNPPANTGDTGSISGWEDLLEKKLAAHSSVLVEEIPWTDGSGGLQSTGSQKVRHDPPVEEQKQSHYFYYRASPVAQR